MNYDKRAIISTDMKAFIGQSQAIFWAVWPPNSPHNLHGYQWPPSQRHWGRHRVGVWCNLSPCHPSMVRKAFYGEGHNLAPSYLSELLKLYAPERENLQSSDKLFLDYSIPSTKYGERAFSVSGCVLWNSLPDDIRLLDDIGSFKSKLKTWLFKDASKKHLWQLCF